MRPRCSCQPSLLSQVVAPADGAEVQLPFTSEGVACNSSSSDVALNGLPTAAAMNAVLRWLANSNTGERKVNYKLRDWLFARQRYWGEPFPVVYPEGSDEAVALREDQLPLELPDLEVFKPSGKPESPLANASEWLKTTHPRTGKPARRDTNTMPQWAGSCWYYLRFIDPDNATMYAADALSAAVAAAATAKFSPAL
jgi:leucyl-tRNA synthetase